MPASPRRAALVKLALIGRYAGNVARVVAYNLGAFEHGAGHLLVPASIQYSEDFAAAEPHQDPHREGAKR